MTTEMPNLIDQLHDLEMSIRAMTEAKLPPEKRRVVSKMAKNIEHGDLMDFGDKGWGEINCWVYREDDDSVFVGAPQLPGLSFKGTDRVRVKRVVS